MRQCRAGLLISTAAKHNESRQLKFITTLVDDYNFSSFLHVSYDTPETKVSKLTYCVINKNKPRLATKLKVLWHITCFLFYLVTL